MRTHALAVLSRVLVVLALFTLGCSSSDPPTENYQPGPGQFGEPCQKTEDCASGVCVNLGNGRGVCSHACSADVACPSSTNWGCLKADNVDAMVCTCAPDSDSEVCGDGADNDCDGLVDNCQLCNGKAIPENDPANCGECGNACRPDQICSLSSCKCPPNAGFECGGSCVDLDTDGQNCGACGTACPAGQSCEKGACVCSDAVAPDYCDGAGCIDLQSNDSNCGACGVTCPSGTHCTEGACECGDAFKPDYCSPAGCVNLQADHANCGSCGNACNADEICSNGACQCYATGYITCGGKCVNPNADPANCGSCGATCMAGQNCSNGSCSCPWTAPNACSTGCTTIATDPDNCGACGNKCPSNLTCVAGACSCDKDKVQCDSACVSLQSDSNNCGACGNVCPSNQYCLVGACKCSTFGLTPCGAQCVDSSTDTQNCGSCGNVCPGTQLCSGGTCKCPTGQTWCTAAGACVDLKTDAQNCGSCANACNPGEACSNGYCACPTSGEKWCASTGVCTDISNNSSHCGACDKACPAGTQCQSYTCKCLTAGQTLCGGTDCYDLQNDPAHCGSCSNACSGNQVCTAGKCGCPAPIVGAPLRLTTTPTDAARPAAAWSGTHVGVVYIENPAGSSQWGDLYFALLNPDGTRAKSPDIALTTTQSVREQPSIVWTGTEFGVAYRRSTSAMFQRLDANGTLLGAPADINLATPGPILPYISPLGLAWSPTYGGYALCSLGSSEVGFQRIGATGTAPEAVNHINILGALFDGNCKLAVSPVGEWGILVGGGGGYDFKFVPVNPDGSKTKPTTTLQVYTYATEVSLVYDGAAWLSAWRYEGSGIRVNRGETLNSPFTAVPFTSKGGDHYNVSTTLSGTGAVELVWTQPNDIRLRRFLVPTSSTSFLTALGGEVSILATPNAIDMTAVHTGSGSMLTLWADNRWGATELYAAPVDFSSCP